MSTQHPEEAGRNDLDAIAQDLLGIDISSDDFEDDGIQLDDDDLPPIASAAEPEPAEATAAEKTLLADETDVESDVRANDVPPAGDDEGNDFGLGLLDFGDDEDEAPEPSRKSRTIPARPASTAPTAAEPVKQTAPAAQPKPVSRAGAKSSKSDQGDDYWDALDGWDWGEGVAGPADTATDEEEPATAAMADAFEEPEPVQSSRKPDEYLEDDDFGIGLEEGETAHRGEKRPAARRGDDEHREGRGRRRGRRRRGPKPELESTEPVDEAVDETEPSQDEGTGFGAGLEVGEEPPPDEGRRRGRGRRSRDRGRRRREPHVPEPSNVEVVESGARDEEVEETEEQDEVRSRDRYRNVPTWTDAIASLVQVKKRTETRQSSERSTRKGDRGSEGSGRGRRRGGGRGRGRRRPTD